MVDPRRRTVTAVVTASVIAFLIGCQSSESPEQTPDLAAPFGPGVGIPTGVGTGMPISLTLVLDAAASAAKSIGSAGGAVTAAGSDGTRFTLEIPPKALAADVTITMTPVASVVGLPLKGGLGGAAEFAPEGLQFLKPATLTIEPARPIPANEQMGFGSTGLGLDFHLVPLVPRTNKIQLLLSHFTVDGVGNGSASDAAGIGASNPIVGYQQLVAEVLAQAKRDGSTASLKDLVGPVAAAAKAGASAYVKSVLKSADCDTASAVVAQAIGQDREDDAFGLSTGSSLVQSDDYQQMNARCREEIRKRFEEACAAGDTAWIATALTRELSARRSFDQNATVEDLMQIRCDPKGWKGTIKVITVTQTVFTSGYSKSTLTESLSQTITVTRTISANSYGQDYSFELQGAITAVYDHTQATGANPNNPAPPPPPCDQWSEVAQTDTLHGTRSGTARVTIIGNARLVSVGVTSEDELEATGTSVRSGREKHGGCQEQFYPVNESHPITSTIGLGDAAFTDNPNPTTLKDKISRKQGDTTLTIEWDLTRE